ncbi:MAG TPA: ornithine cyclodeaminase family protein [Thermoanaerobaculia bacterium]|nr:ornithine cyclodeaminase family protein [Thermoanaerobaculia bacterium]
MKILSGEEYNALVSIDDCIAAVEEAFRQHGEGTLHAGLLSTHVHGGAFHIKTSTYGRSCPDGTPTFSRPVRRSPIGADGKSADRPIEDRRSVRATYFAAKLNANFPGNAPLPTIQGVLVLFDATNGVPLAVIDSIEVTKQRTAAASAVAAKYLARRGSRTLTIYGCGQQAAAQLAAIRSVLPIERVNVIDADRSRAEAFAKEHDAHVGAEPADVIVTCTTSRTAFLRDAAPGTFIAAVGADNPEKSEIDPELMGRAVVVADVLDQCAAIGDLRAAIAAGTMTRDGVRAELGAIVAARAEGRRNDAEIIIFDSTGAGFQDAAAAVMAYERA